MTVALALPPNPFIRDEARARGWRLVHLWYSDYYLPPDIVPRGALVDLLPDDVRVLKLRRAGCQVVRLGNLPQPDDDKVPAVLPDHVAEGRLAAEHFAERGFRHVGYVGSDPWRELRVLFDAFQARAVELGMVCHLHRITSPPEGTSREEMAAGKQRAFATWLRSVPKPLGLLAYHDWRAAAFATWASEAGFRLPADIAILGRGDHPDICEFIIPSLSSLDQDKERQVRTACDLLGRLMDGEAGPGPPILVPPRGVTVRESTNVLGVADPTVAAAVAFMWQHLEQDLSVQEVAREVGVPRHRLERAFREHLGRGVAAELLRRRLAVLAGLLRSTDTPVIDLAPRVGFRNMAHLHRQFRRAYGTSPARYRKAHGQR